MKNDDNKIIITVTGIDKVGIVSAVSACLAEHSVNIEDIKQTIMQDNFVMIMLCDIKKIKVSFKEAGKKTKNGNMGSKERTF